jgi:hypothetical protein
MAKLLVYYLGEHVNTRGLAAAGSCGNLGALIWLRLFARQAKARLKGGKRHFHGLPGIINRQQQNTITKMPDTDLRTGKAERFRQTNGLATTRLKNACGFHK